MMVVRYPNLKKEVGCSILVYEISSLFDRNLPGGWLLPVCQKRKKEVKSVRNIARAQSEEFFWLNQLLSYIFSNQPVFWSILSARCSENEEYSLIFP